MFHDGVLGNRANAPLDRFPIGEFDQQVVAFGLLLIDNDYPIRRAAQGSRGEYNIGQQLAPPFDQYTTPSLAGGGHSRSQGTSGASKRAKTTPAHQCPAITR